MPICGGAKKSILGPVYRFYLFEHSVLVECADGTHMGFSDETAPDLIGQWFSAGLMARTYLSMTETVTTE